jgi:hypothetical protein
MRVRSIIIILLMLAMAACGINRRELDSNPPFAPHHYGSFDVEIAWQAERAGRNVRLSGTVTNHRYAFLRDLELKGRLLDAEGETLARETVADFPTYIPPGKSAPFHMNLTLPDGSTPARLRFNYTYLLAEEPPVVGGYGGYDDIPHFGTFDAPL